MALFDTHTKEALEKLTPSRSIPTSRTIDTKSVEMAAQDAARADAARAGADQAIAQGDLAIGRDISRSVQGLAKVTLNTEKNKYENIYHSTLSQIKAKLNQGIYLSENSVKPSDLQSISAATNATIMGIRDAAKQGVPKAIAEQIDSMSQAAITHLSQVTQTKIGRITWDTNFTNLHGSLDSQISLLAYKFVSEPSSRKRRDILQQGHKLVDTIQSYQDSATTLGQLDKARQLKERALAKLSIITTPPKPVTSTAAVDSQDIFSNHIHNTGSLSSQAINGVWFNADNVYNPPPIPHGSAKAIVGLHNTMVEVNQERLNFGASAHPMSYLTSMLGSSNSTVVKLARDTIKRIQDGKALNTLVSMFPNSDLTQKAHLYSDAINAGTSRENVFQAYHSLMTAIGTASSRYGIPANKFNIDMPNTQANWGQVVGSTKITDEHGQTADYNLLSDSDSVNQMMTNTLRITHGRNLPGGNELTTGLNMAQGEAYNVSGDGTHKPLDSAQVQLDIYSFNKDFQNHQAKNKDIYSDPNKGTQGAISGYSSRSSLRYSIMSSGDFPVKQVATVLGVSPSQVTDSLLSKIEYRASKGDTNAVQTVKNNINKWVGTHQMVTVPQHFYEKSPTMYVKKSVWDSYTGSDQLDDSDNRSIGNKVIQKGIIKMQEIKKEQLLAQWRSIGKYADKTDEERNNVAENEAKDIVGDSSNYGLVSHGDQVLVTRAGDPTKYVYITPLDVHNAQHKIEKEKGDHRKEKSQDVYIGGSLYPLVGVKF